MARPAQLVDGLLGEAEERGYFLGGEQVVGQASGNFLMGLA